MKQLIGRVLWFRARDGFGIIVDPQGNEFYFDQSVLRISPRQKVERNKIVTFYINEKITELLCARNVSVPADSKQKLIEKKFSKNELGL
ncbi:MAG TPA: hypothetical protein VNJ01_15540 [Bacteriovoracaceae bacterium]|nr:hypothetical protein [Bacteriovoracaceae bacterium]